MQNYLKEQPTSTKKPKELLLEIFKRFIDIPNG